MHQNFSDWYQPVTFGHDRETLEYRWQGIEAALESMDFDMNLELVRFVFNRDLISEESLATFRQYFKEVDPTFKSTGNEQELITLAGCVLAIYCINDDYDETTGLAIVNASTCGIRKLAVDIDLVGMANDKIRISGIQSRSRKVMMKPKHVGNKKTFTDLVLPLEQAQNIPAAIDVIKKMGEVTVTHIKALQNNFSAQIENMQHVLTVQDEELQILWWLTGEWSGMWNCAFNDIEPIAKPILLGEDTASMTTEFSEPPALKSVFSRIGLNGTDKLSIPYAVNACGVEKLEDLSQNRDICPSIFPIHFAMERAKETKANKSWVASWRSITKIKATSKVTPLELAIQVFRERKLLTYIQEPSE